MKEKIAWFIFRLKSILTCLALCFVIVVVKSSKNLSFWLEDYRETHYFGNFSGTGAGKTLSAVLASRVIDSKMTLIVCPNDEVNGQEIL